MLALLRHSARRTRTPLTSLFPPSTTRAHATMPLKLDYEVATEPIGKPQVGRGGYVGLKTHTETLPKGWKYDHPNARPLDCDIVVDHDTPIKMRDGKTIYADIFRPAGTSEKVPVIVLWSPFGKKFNDLLSLGLMVPWDLGVKPGTLSGLGKFEAPDPNHWIPRGYALANVDVRGTGDSEGVMVCLGTQEAEDGYDCIEALAKMDWCNGNVGMAGNSHLAISQWFIAALRPPSLKAIAPWEGCGDLYREQFVRGGIYNGDLFDKLIVKYMLQGQNGMESNRLQFKKQPLADAWWNDKRPDMSKINIPTYITGTWSNTMHGMGAIRGWMQVDTEDKWMRWHPTQEWYDMYANEEGRKELMQFFDCYLKGKTDNGWKDTPKIRMAVVRFGKKEPQSYDGIVEEEFPPKRTQYKNFYFTTEGKLVEEAPAPKTNDAVQSYNSETAENVQFVYTFPETTTVLGMPRAVVYMSCPDNDDLDVYVQIEKLDKDGKQMTALNIPWEGIPPQSFEEMKPEEMTEVVTYKGPVGILRASHRAIDESKSIHPNWPFHPHDKEEKITPGDIVRLDIGIWALGVEFEAGESVRVVVSGQSRAVNNFGTTEHSLNKGTHNVHIGGEHASHIILPFV